MGGIVRGDVVESTDVMVPAPSGQPTDEDKKKAEEAKKAADAAEVKKP
jgi:hypothetical protein